MIINSNDILVTVDGKEQEFGVDYEIIEGQVTFKIAPEAGTVVVFDVGYENIHGVTEVTSGQRWTMLASFDYADSTYPDEYWEQKQKELEQTAKIHEQQHQQWEQGIKEQALK